MEKTTLEAAGHTVTVYFKYSPKFGICIHSWEAGTDIPDRYTSEEIEESVNAWANEYEVKEELAHEDFKYQCWKDDELCSR